MIAAFPAIAQAAVTESTDANALAAALTTPGANVTGAAFVTAPSGEGVTPNGVSTTALAGFPTGSDSSYAVLTTGDVHLIDDGEDPDPDDHTNTGYLLGGGNVRGNTDYDVTVLRVDFTAPAGTNCLRFDFKFLSEEYPDYLDSEYNDAFIAELDTSSWTTVDSDIVAGDNFAFDPSNNPISINSTGTVSMTPGHAFGTPYNAATPVLTAARTVTPGAHSLYLSIFDQGDEDLDSAVFVDNLVVGYSPNPQEQCAPGAQLKSYTMDLTPSTATKGTGTTHTVTAIVNQLDPAGPVVGGVVHVTVTGANAATSGAPTNASGALPFSYTGTNEGTDTIVACFDANTNGTCDAGDVTASATVTWVTEPPVDDSPSVDAGGPYTATSPGPVSLTGVVDFPSENPVTVTWDNVVGPYYCEFSDVHSLTPTATCDAVGTYTVSLSATDGETTVWDTATIVMTLPSDGENEAPTNDAGGPYTGAEDEPIALAGTASDVDEDELTHTWSVEGPGTCTFSDPTSLTPTIACDEDGLYTLTLTTSDGTSSTSDTASLKVGCEPKPAPTEPTEGPTTPSLPVTGSSLTSVMTSGVLLVTLGVAALVLGRVRRARTEI
jgi:hypothetical protein